MVVVVPPLTPVKESNPPVRKAQNDQVTRSFVYLLEIDR